MKCLHCGHNTVVKDGRYTDGGYWRRRKCPSCGAETTTLEQVCETIKGTRARQPVVAKPVTPAVIRPKRPRENAKPKPHVYVPQGPVGERRAKARKAIEDRNMEKEYELG